LLPLSVVGGRDSILAVFQFDLEEELTSEKSRGIDNAAFRKIKEF